MGDDSSKWLKRFARIRPWKSGEQQAPHKPLLVLMALAAWQSSGSSELVYGRIKKPLGDLIVEFGGASARPNPHQPFGRLSRQKVWDLSSTIPEEHLDNSAKYADDLSGRFPAALERELGADPRLGPDIAHLVLSRAFPASLHEEIAAAVGLDLTRFEVGLVRDRVFRSLRPRDPKFRIAVLGAYSERCAMCGFGGSVAGRSVGVEAAHIKWHAADGPDEVANGFALCANHHKLFDRGVLGVLTNGRIQVSDLFDPRSDADEVLVSRLEGQPITEPRLSEDLPSDEYLEWHMRRVFKTGVAASTR